MQSGQDELGFLMKPRGSEGFNKSSSSVASFGPKEKEDLRRIEAWKPTVEVRRVADGQKVPSDQLAEAKRCGPSHA